MGGGRVGQPAQALLQRAKLLAQTKSTPEGIMDIALRLVFLPEDKKKIKFSTAAQQHDVCIHPFLKFLFIHRCIYQSCHICLAFCVYNVITLHGAYTQRHQPRRHLKAGSGTRSWSTGLTGSGTATARSTDPCVTLAALPRSLLDQLSTRQLSTPPRWQRPLQKFRVNSSSISQGHLKFK